jgi:hypothetical protein
LDFSRFLYYTCLHLRLFYHHHHHVTFI